MLVCNSQCLVTVVYHDTQACTRTALLPQYFVTKDMGLSLLQKDSLPATVLCHQGYGFFTITEWQPSCHSTLSLRIYKCYNVTKAQQETYLIVAQNIMLDEVALGSERVT